jgi:hypothetical protein
MLGRIGYHETHFSGDRFCWEKEWNTLRTFLQVEELLPGRGKEGEEWGRVTSGIEKKRPLAC